MNYAIILQINAKESHKMGQVTEEILKFINEDIAKTLEEDKEKGFSWELYFKFNLWNKCNILINEKLLKIVQEKSVEDNKEVLQEISEILEEETKNNKIQKLIDSIKDKLLKDRKLKVLTFIDKEREIYDFFISERGINYQSLNKEEKYELLKNEDITYSENKIHDHLKITHMQYKYLYQTGETLI